MSRLGFMINPDLLHDWEANKMSNAVFVEKFRAAARGEQNELSRLVKPWNGRLPAHEWRVIRSRIFERDDYTCQYCGDRGNKLECDHVIPLSRGGSDQDENLVTACKPCNRSKRDKTPEEWRANA